MKELNNLLDKIKETRSLASDNALAAALGVKRQTVSNWRKGHNYPDAVACATIAGLTGEPLARVLGIVGEARAISREEKTVWRRLAASAAAVLVLVGVSGIATQSVARDGDANMYYAKWAGMLSVAQLLALWIRWKLSRTNAGPDRMEARTC